PKMGIVKLQQSTYGITPPCASVRGSGGHDMRRYRLVITVTAAVFILTLWLTRRPKTVNAQNNEWVTQELQNNSGGGMAQYGAQELSSTSASSDLQVMTNWNNYINARCGWSLSSSELSR